MNQYLVQIIFVIAISARTWSHPLDATDSKNLIDREFREGARANSSVCRYKGKPHEDGELVVVDEPCLVCHCKVGALTCNLRICPDVPDPPPPNCYILHRRNECCPRMLCEAEKKESELEVRTVDTSSDNLKGGACFVNGSVYAEGSALESSDSCEYCYCINGRQMCIKPKCSVPFDDCRALYSANSCCPTRYDCRGIVKSGAGAKVQSIGCSVGNITFAEGEMLPKNNSNCANCYCMNGEIQCVPITCDMDLNINCKPVHMPGQCCPTSFICSQAAVGISENSIRSFSSSLEDSDQSSSESQTKASLFIPDVGASTGAGPFANSTELSTTTTTIQRETSTESTTSSYETDETVKTRTEDREITEGPENSTESRLQKNYTQILERETTQEFATEELTVPNFTSRSSIQQNAPPDISLRNNIDFPSPENNTAIANENITPSPVLEQLFIDSPQMDDEYDSYDYNEPRLPPSLPNLIIFPFVAADAIVKDDEIPKTPKYDGNNIKRIGTEGAFYKDYFSPPTKTEGGFIPKQPQDSFAENAHLIKEGDFSNIKRIDGYFPSISTRPKTNSEQCMLRGRIYDHGELVPELVGCQPCICYYSEILCQQVICPPVRKGCTLSSDKDPVTCCGRITCELTDEGDGPAKYESIINSSEKAIEKSVETPMTVPDSEEISQNPVKDLIRTEIPGLPSLVDDLAPVLAEAQTKKPVTVAYKNLIVDYYPDYLITTTREDVQKKNYNNPMFYTTEIYPFTNSMPERLRPRSTTPLSSGNVTFSVQSTVTNSLSTSRYDPYGTIDFLKTSSRPVLTIATEPSSFFYSTTSRQETKSGRVTTKRTRTPALTRPRPAKKTTQVPDYIKIDQHSTPSSKSSNTGKYKYSTKGKGKTSTTSSSRGKYESQTKPTADKGEAQDSFSLDNVLRFFFDTDATTTTTTTARPTHAKSTFPTRKTTKKDATKKYIAGPYAAASTKAPEWAAENPAPTTREYSSQFKYKDFKSKVQADEVTSEPPRRNTHDVEQTSKKQGLGSLLKLAGCNIYGRMYRVGKIINELSNSCLECICTDIGVECNPLTC